MLNLLELLIVVSEKAANIARACRQDQNLFELLVQEKSSGEANARFVQDFKTLADVLIQETVRYEIEKHFPEVGQYIKGEENNIFTNILGETVEIKILGNEPETSELLEKVLDGNKHAANVLANEVHKSISINDVNTKVPEKFQINSNNIGIWIDPIDSTAEYISGKEIKHEAGIYLAGLQCVTVLIGAYNRETGQPILGIVNQPFHNQITSNHWTGKCFWGSYTSESQSSVESVSNESHIISLSKVELTTIKTKLTESNYQLIEAAGAGYKLLTVINGLADAYIVSQGTTFRWDVCGPHGILRALNGGVYDFQELCHGVIKEIDYKDESSANDTKINKYCNQSGLVAVKNRDVLQKILNILNN